MVIRNLLPINVPRQIGFTDEELCSSFAESGTS
jgi:hypothetical protein